MKKKYAGANFVLLLYLLNVLINPVAAIEAGERIDYEDGSYAIIMTGTDSMTRAAKDDSKTYTYYNPTGQRCFSYTPFYV